MKIMIDKGAFLPLRAHDTDAGLDLFSPVSVWLHPGEHTMIDTGVHVAIPAGHVGLITSKSIDAGYTGSIRAILYNHGAEGYRVNRGDKVCQLVLMPIITPELEVVDALDETERGENGFGSTGR